MRRAITGISALALAAGSAAGALAAPNSTSKPGRPSVAVADCHPSDDVSERYASFNAQTRAVPGTTRMAVRFTLLERLNGIGRFKPVSLSDLRSWRRSKPGARSFIYTQRVTALHDGGYYRMRVQFRWYDAQGTVLRTAVVRSGVCHQPTPLPDLTITSVTAAPGATADQRNYSVTVANAGKGEARDVEVALKVDGTVVGGSRVDLLPGEESMVVQIPGPACALTVRAIADPYGMVRETDDTDNALSVPCTQAGA
jgi:hypothetical protein